MAAWRGGLGLGRGGASGGGASGGGRGSGGRGGLGGGVAAWVAVAWRSGSGWRGAVARWKRIHQERRPRDMIKNIM